jgi:hypothetical protein
MEPVMYLVPILSKLIRENSPHSRYLIIHQSARYRIPQLSAKTALIRARGSSIDHSVPDTCERDRELVSIFLGYHSRVNVTLRHWLFVFRRFETT